MNKWILSALALGACSVTYASSPTLGQFNKEIERIGAMILSGQLGLPQDEILRTSDRYDRSVYDLAPLYSIQRQTRRSSDEIWRLRQSGLGWGQIAQRLGMHPGTFNKMRVRGEFDNDWRWDDIMRDRYGWSDSQIRERRKRGDRWTVLFQEAETRKKSGKGMKGHDDHGSMGHKSTTHGKSGTKSHGGGSTKGGGPGKGHGKGGGHDDHGNAGTHGKSGDHGKGNGKGKGKG
jgi:hypothetical protein